MVHSQISADFTKKVKTVKPINAVNNGPFSFLATKTGNFREYEALKIPFARNHDAAFFSGYTGDVAVDVHRIFRNFDADENNPASYDFRATDDYIKVTAAAGTKTFYRLGAAIEHYIKVGTIPPKDFGKWARICEHIVRHYTEGWADGFDADIKYWEIWNEPDCINPDGTNPCWQGTEEQFFDLFEITFKHLKSCFPHLKIGGPAMTCVGDAMRRFLFEMKKRGVEPDFISYHYYGCSIRDFRDTIRRSDEAITECGFPNAERILNEWNYNIGWVGEERIRSAKERLGWRAAAFACASMMMAQREPVDMFMFYDFRPQTSFNIAFGPYTMDILPGYYAFVCIRDIKELGTETLSTEDPDNGIYTLATSDGKNGVVGVCRYTDEGEKSEDISLSVTLPAPATYAVKVVSYGEAGIGETVSETTVTGTTADLRLSAAKNSFLTVTFTAV